METQRKQLLSNVDIVSFELTNIDGRTIDIRKMFLSITLYTSIFNHFVHGNIVLMDTFDLQKNFPIVGNEDVEIQIKTDNQEVGELYKFKIYSLEGDLETVKQTVVNKKVLILHFCSAEQLLNEKRRISKKYDDKAETIISSILTNDLQSTKNLESEATTDNIVVFSNYWKPSKIIDFSCRLSKNSTYSDYMFFDKLNGFVFKPLSTLMSQDPVMTVTFEEGIKTLAATNNIKAVKTESKFDLIKSYNERIFGLTQYKPHETEYSYTLTESLLTDTYSNLYTSGNNNFFDSNLEDTDGNVIVNYYDNDITKIRPTSIQLLDNYRIAIRLSGSFERKVGDTIKIENKTYDNGFVDIVNYDERYIIGKIKSQIFQNGMFDQNLLLLKNSFASNLSTNDV